MTFMERQDTSMPREDDRDELPSRPRRTRRRRSTPGPKTIPAPTELPPTRFAIRPPGTPS